MNFYNFHIQDFRGRAWHLDNVHAYAYRLLIDEYYLNEKPLTADVEMLAHKIRYTTETEKAALREVFAEFFVLKKGKYHHDRIDREIKNYQYRRNKPAMLKRLAELGVAFDKNMSVAELSALLAMYDDDFSVTAGNAGNEKVTAGNETSNEVSNGNSNAGNALSNAERQALYKQRQRENVLLELQELGLNPDKSMSLNGLKNLLEKARNEKVTAGNETSNEVSNGEILSNAKSNGKKHAITNNQEPVTNKQQQQQSREEKNFSQPEKPTAQIDVLADALPERFAMHANWQPNDMDLVNGLLRRAKLPNWDTGLILDAALDFVSYWVARPEVMQTAMQWDAEFTRSAAKYRAKFGHKYDTTTWELKSHDEQSTTVITQTANNHAPTQSKTKQSVMTLMSVREAVVSDSLKTVLPKSISLVLVDGLLDLLGNNLKYPPAADSWEFTLTAWANEFARSHLGDDDVGRVQAAFNAAKAKATHPDNHERRFPDVADVLSCLPMKLVQKQLEHKLSQEEWAEQSAKGRERTAGLKAMLNRKAA